MNPVTGTGTQIALTPGQDLYIRVKATTSSFASSVYHLDVPVRPSAPSSITIDFDYERTNEVITSGMEYTTSSSFTVSTAGAGNQIALTPRFVYPTKRRQDPLIDCLLLDVPQGLMPCCNSSTFRRNNGREYPINNRVFLKRRMISPVSGTNEVIALTLRFLTSPEG
jgi:hypothetical protein